MFHSSLIFDPMWTGSRQGNSRFLNFRSWFSLTMPIQLAQFESMNRSCRPQSLWVSDV